MPLGSRRTLIDRAPGFELLSCVWIPFLQDPWGDRGTGLESNVLATAVALSCPVGRLVIDRPVEAKLLAYC